MVTTCRIRTQSKCVRGTGYSRSQANNVLHVSYHVQQLRSLVAVRSRRDTTCNWICRFQPLEDSLFQHDLPCRFPFHYAALHGQRIVVAHFMRYPSRKLLDSCTVNQVVIEFAVPSTTCVYVVVSLTETLDLGVLWLVYEKCQSLIVGLPSKQPHQRVTRRLQSCTCFL